MTSAMYSESHGVSSIRVFKPLSLSSPGTGPSACTCPPCNWWEVRFHCHSWCIYSSAFNLSLPRRKSRRLSNSSCHHWWCSSSLTLWYRTHQSSCLWWVSWAILSSRRWPFKLALLVKRVLHVNCIVVFFLVHNILQKIISIEFVFSNRFGNITKKNCLGSIFIADHCWNNLCYFLRDFWWARM